jgi:hypothetical protein
MSILGIGTTSYQRHCGHTVYLAMEQQKLLLYHLLYGQEAVLLWQITVGSRCVEFQNDLTAEEYATLMNDNVEDLTELRLWSLEKIKENKVKVARVYNKKVKPKEFQVGDLVWEAVLPLGTKDAVRPRATGLCT